MSSERRGCRVVQLAAGEAHTLALTDSGLLYAWGRGFFGRLGTGKETDELVPTHLVLRNKSEGDASSTLSAVGKLSIHGMNSQDNVANYAVGIAAGAYHSLALSADGVVWSWGYNDYGQLGHNSEVRSIPNPVNFHDSSSTECDQVDGNSHVSPFPLKMVAIEAGGMMSCAIDEKAKLWMWGLCPSTKPDSSSPSTLYSLGAPECVKGIGDHRVLRVACGNGHVLALAVPQLNVEPQSGVAVCFAWGDNSKGQLGLGDTKNRSSPQLIDSFSKSKTEHPFDLSCGAFHSAVLVGSERNTHIKSACLDVTVQESLTDSLLASNANGNSNHQSSTCWTFGEGANGQLGHGTSAPTMLPSCVQGLPAEQNWVSVKCGLFHTAIVSETGEVWVWGMQNGLGLFPGSDPSQIEGGDALVPFKIFARSSAGQKTFVCSRGIACGAAHTVTLASEGYRIFSWGRGQNGVLGSGQTVDSLIPCPVIWPPPDQFSACKESEIFFEEEKTKAPEALSQRSSDRDTEVKHELEIKLSLALEEISALKKEVTYFRNHAESLQFAIYGGLQTPRHQNPEILGVSDNLREDSSSFLTIPGYGAAYELQKTLQASNYADLLRFETFYKDMLSEVQDLILHKKVEKLVQSCFRDLSMPRTSNAGHVVSDGSIPPENLMANKEYSVSLNPESYSVEELKKLAMRLHRS